MRPERVGIVTIVDLQNFGNRLQNYATHDLLRQRGLEPLTLAVGSRAVRSRIRRWHYAATKDALGGTLPPGRFHRFHRFTRDFVPFADLTDRHIGELQERFDYFVIGSDQVWNPNDSRLGGRLDGLQFLIDIEAGRKSLISPSFGLSELPVHYHDLFGSGLRTFDNLIVREQRGSELIHELSGRSAEVMIDPTMAIEVSQWRGLASARVMASRPYMVSFMLGSESAARQRALQRLAASRHLEIVDLADQQDRLGRRAGPQEFLGLMAGAELIVTDSYHCSVFAFLFERPLLVVGRHGAGAHMSSRLDTLLADFSLTGRSWDTDEPAPDDAFDADYSRGLQILSERRRRFVEHLDSEVARMRRYRDGQLMEKQR